MLGELLRVLLVSLELPPAETAQAIGNALPGSGFYGVDTILKPAPQNPFIERLPIDDDMVQAIHGHAIAAALRKPLGAANRQVEGLLTRAVPRPDHQPCAELETGCIVGQRPRVRVECDLAEYGAHYPMMTYCQ